MRAQGNARLRRANTLHTFRRCVEDLLGGFRAKIHPFHACSLVEFTR